MHHLTSTHDLKKFPQQLNYYTKPLTYIKRCQYLYIYLLSQILTIYNVIFRQWSVNSESTLGHIERHI